MLTHSKLFKVVLIISLLLGCFNFISATFANTVTPVGRYLSVENQTLPAQTNLLQQTFQVKFPPTVKTVGEAMQYLLRFSGYSLVNYKYLPSEAQALLIQPLPQVDRNIGPLNLQKGLITLAGEPFGLLVDPVHRLISLRLKPAYQSIYHVNAA